MGTPGRVGDRPHPSGRFDQVLDGGRLSAGEIVEHGQGAAQRLAPGRSVQVEVVRVAARDVEQAVGTSSQQQAGSSLVLRCGGEAVRAHVVAVDRRGAVIEERPRQPTGLLEAIESSAVTRHLDAERVELLGVPAGADPDEHPITAVQARELSEVPEDEGGVGEADVGHQGAEVQALRQCSDRGEDHEGVVASEGGGAVASGREEEVVRQEHPVDAEVVEAGDPRSQAVEVAHGAECHGDVHRSLLSRPASARGPSSAATRGGRSPPGTGGHRQARRPEDRLGVGVEVDGQGPHPPRRVHHRHHRPGVVGGVRGAAVPHASVAEEERPLRNGHAHRRHLGAARFEPLLRNEQPLPDTGAGSSVAVGPGPQLERAVLLRHVDERDVHRERRGRRAVVQVGPQLRLVPVHRLRLGRAAEHRVARVQRQLDPADRAAPGRRTRRPGWRRSRGGGRRPVGEGCAARGRGRRARRLGRRRVEVVEHRRAQAIADLRVDRVEDDGGAVLAERRHDRGHPRRRHVPASRSAAVTETVANGWSEWSASPFVAEIDSTFASGAGWWTPTTSPVASAG